MIDVFLHEFHESGWTFVPRQAMWALVEPPSRPAGEVPPFSGPLPAGWCKVPPRGLTWDRYKPDKHGPTVYLYYDVAALTQEARQRILSWK